LAVGLIRWRAWAAGRAHAWGAKIRDPDSSGPPRKELGTWIFVRIYDGISGSINRPACGVIMSCQLHRNLKMWQMFSFTAPSYYASSVLLSTSNLADNLSVFYEIFIEGRCGEAYK
jgi:hypothetical protein